MLENWDVHIESWSLKLKKIFFSELNLFNYFFVYLCRYKSESFYCWRTLGMLAKILGLKMYKTGQLFLEWPMNFTCLEARAITFMTVSLEFCTVYGI